MATILITGATAGIGRASALLLLRKGHRVIAAGRNEASLAELKTAGAVPLVLDVTSDADVEAAKAQVDALTKGRGVDVLINNAGYAQVGPIERVSDAQWRAQYETNVFGVLRMLRAFVPQMRERRQGRIINVSSVVGRLALPFFGPYNSTKHAIEAISDSLRQELAPHNVFVTLIEPGAINTGFGAIEHQGFLAHAGEGAPYAAQVAQIAAFQKQIHPNAASPQLVARKIAKAIGSARPKARYVVPFLRNRIFIALAQFLPTGMTDGVVGRITGLERVKV
ncbi:MAG: SDR family oxidoreductase [Alphaproteobacteria bacterium]|nr:SDR family oxidoreductase [Alphaproteobacteria bacterium]